MSRKSLLLISLLLLLCLVLSFSLYSIKLSNANVCNDDNNVVYGYKNANYIEAFDVIYFASYDINTIDIASKYYDNNVISIADSDFVISEKLSNKIYSLINNYGARSSF